MAGLHEGQSSSDEGSNEPQSFLFNVYNVYNLKELIEYDQAYFYGCIKSNRKAIEKKKIPSDSFFYAKKISGKWLESHEGYKNAKILIKSEWVESNVDKFVKNLGVEVSPSKLREAPPILDLEEHEKFRDDTGNIHEVEVRGVRDEDKIFFKASDIERLFEMENLVHDIIRKIQTTVYKHGEDYVFFLITQKGHRALSGLSEHRVKTTFLTYNGLIKVIYRSNSGTAHKFRKWATGVIYTAHLGTEEQRDELALELTGINHNIVRQTFSARTFIVYISF